MSCQLQDTDLHIALADGSTVDLFRLPSQILNLYRAKWVVAFTCFNFLFVYALCLATCARLSWPHLAFQFTLNSSIVLYRARPSPETLDFIVASLKICSLFDDIVVTKAESQVIMLLA